MKTNIKAIYVALLFATGSLLANADEVEVRPLPEEATVSEPVLPIAEREFVDAISKFDKAAIVAQMGDPATADDVRLKGTDKIVASIWHYHYVNTDKDGTYYQTTELDFVDNKVVQVVFLNNDGSDVEGGQKYEVPQGKPDADTPEASPNKEPGDGVPLIEY